MNYGIIASPNYPNKYDGPARNLASKTCNWFIRVRPNQRILLHFEAFSVEGDQSGISMFFNSSILSINGVGLSERPKSQSKLLVAIKNVISSVRGCPAAVLRIWYSASSTPVEICGIQTLDKNWTYLSVDNNMRLRFVFRTSDSNIDRGRVRV